MSYGCGLWSDKEVMSFVYNNLEVFILSVLAAKRRRVSSVCAFYKSPAF